MGQTPSPRRCPRPSLAIRSLARSFVLLAPRSIDGERTLVEPRKLDRPAAELAPRSETGGAKDGCGAPCSQRGPYHRNPTLRLGHSNRQERPRNRLCEVRLKCIRHKPRKGGQNSASIE